MNAHPETPDQLEQLVSRLAALERRVAALEPASPPSIALPVREEAQIQRTGTAPQATPSTDIAMQFTGVLSVFGASLLGIAGAYVLRAVSGASLLPRGLVAAVAAAYAAAWLVFAMHRTRGKLAAALYAATSILILAPMLWEMSIRFAAMPVAAAVAMLCIYAAVATVSGFLPARGAVFAVSYIGIALTAVALAVGTRQMGYFGVILLAMIAICELTPAREQAGAARPLVALCGDFVVWTLLFIYRLPVDERREYPALAAWVVIAAALLLPLLAAGSTILRTLREREEIEAFQVVQALIAFGLMACAFGWMAPAAATAAIGILCLLLAGACYAAAYGPFRERAQKRNFRIFALWGFALFLGAIFLLAPVSGASALLAVGGLVAVVLGDRMRLLSVELQGVMYLSIGAVVSGMVTYALHGLTGAMPGTPAWPQLIAAACSLLAYGAADELPGEPVQKQVLHLVPALLTAGALAAFVVSLLARLLKQWLSPDAVYIALLRTITLCAVSLLLAWVGTRLNRVQMVRLAYGALVFAGVKLLFEDMRLGRMEFIAASIGLVALTLIGVPRLARRRGASGT